MIRMIKNVTAQTIRIKDLKNYRIPSGAEIEIPSSETLNFILSDDLLSEIRSGTIQVGNGAIFYEDALEGECYFRTLFGDNAYVVSGTELGAYTPIMVTDFATGKKASSMFMNMLTIMRELYNAKGDPLYVEGFQPILGSGGWAEDHASRILNMESMHGKIGWHNRELIQAAYKRPQDLLIYYGWINSFNSAQNGWNNELVAQDMAKYGLVVLGDGVQDPAHGDFANTSVVIPRIKALNPNCKIFGYVSSNQDIEDFMTKADQWDALEVDGIFMDESGYDYGVTRDMQNMRIGHVRGLAHAYTCFLNAWNMDHIIGVENDAGYPNSTYNPDIVESDINDDDWYLLESFAVNTAVYTPDGIAPATDWMYRGAKAMAHRNTYGINLASVGIIDEENVGASDYFNFAFVSSLMWALEANGSGDLFYGASTAKTTYYSRLAVGELGRIFNISPAIVFDTTDNDVYMRFVDFGRLILDFSSGAWGSSVEVH